MWLTHSMAIYIHFTPDKVRGAVERDPIHSTIYRLTIHDWPERIPEIPCIACHFWGTRDRLTIGNKILLKGDRVCIPSELYKRVLKNLLSSHRGIDKMRHLSQTTVSWNGMDADITSYINQ